MADDVSFFVSSHCNIEVIQKALERYKKVTGSRINRLGLTDLFAFLECGSTPTEEELVGDTGKCQNS